MKSIKWMLALLLLGLAASDGAWARHRGHVHLGVVVGPVWGPYWYPPPRYYYPPYPYYAPVVVERAVAPQVYIEQPAPAPAPPVVQPPPQINYWYYCDAAKAYYPYVNACPGGWTKVLPHPPGQP